MAAPGSPAYGSAAGRMLMRRLAPFFGPSDPAADASFVNELTGAAIDLSEKTGLPSAYSLLTGNDPHHWDAAVGILAALRGVFGAAGLAAGGLTQQRTADGSQEQYMTPSETDMAAWHADLAAAISRLSFVAARRQPALKNFNLSAVGQRRSRGACAGDPFALGGLLSVDDIVSDLTNNCQVINGYGGVILGEALYGGDACGSGFAEDLL